MSLSNFAIFTAGILTFLSPCVLPLVPVYLATLSGGSLHDARAGRTFAVATAFTTGLSIVFVLLGALASGFGEVLLAQRTWLSMSSGALMVLFGLRAFGFMRLPWLDRDARPALTRVRAVSSVGGAFLFGAAFALGWSPCIGPVLASVLTYAATHSGSPWQGAGYLAVYAAGLSAPLLLLALLVKHATAALRRTRGAIPVFEKLAGAALVLVGAWTVWDTLQDAPPREVVAVQGEGAERGAACDAEHGVCALAVELPKGSAGGARSLPPLTNKLLEFTSHDCPACQRMKPVLDGLIAACTEVAERVVHVDVTTTSGRALASRHGVRGTPTFVLLDERGDERERLLGETKAEHVASAIERAFGISCFTIEQGG